jgi:hypothetical protein
LACYQERRDVAGCESLPYKPLKKWYEDYRTKGKYSADLLWDRGHRLKSEAENHKTWEQIKRDAAAKMPDTQGSKWYRWDKRKRGIGHMPRFTYSRSTAGHYKDDDTDGESAVVGAGPSSYANPQDDPNFAWPDDDDQAAPAARHAPRGGGVAEIARVISETMR